MVVVARAVLFVLLSSLPAVSGVAFEGDVAKQHKMLVRRESDRSNAGIAAANEGVIVGDSADLAAENSEFLLQRQQQILESVRSSVSTGSIAGGTTFVDDMNGDKMLAEAEVGDHKIDEMSFSASLVEGTGFESAPAQLAAIKDKAKSWMTVNGATLTVDPKKISLFCFAWTVRRPGYEEDSLPEIKKQLEACDGHAVFTDEEAVGPDVGINFVKVSVPKQALPRRAQKGELERDNHWLYHRNMAGIMQAWKYLLEQNIAEKYDWVLNTEFDHFVRPSQVRSNIGGYMQTLWSGAPDERLRVGKAMMLMWGNAFVFSNDAVLEMKKQWPTLGKTMAAGTTGSGCPDWMNGHPFFPNECSQDIVFPVMAMIMRPPIASYGAPGCGQLPQNARGQAFPLPCYQMSQSPFGSSETQAKETIKAVAKNHTQKNDGMILLEANGDAGLPLPLPAKFERSAGQETETEQQMEKKKELEQETENKKEAEGMDEQASEYALKIDTMINHVDSLSQEAAMSERANTLQGQLEHFARWLRRQSSIQARAKRDFVPDFNVPIYHQVYWPSVHKLGRELLGL